MCNRNRVLWALSIWFLVFFLASAAHALKKKKNRWNKGTPESTKKEKNPKDKLNIMITQISSLPHDGNIAVITGSAETSGGKNLTEAEKFQRVRVKMLGKHYRLEDRELRAFEDIFNRYLETHPGHAPNDIENEPKQVTEEKGRVSRIFSHVIQTLGMLGIPPEELSKGWNGSFMSSEGLLDILVAHALSDVPPATRDEVRAAARITVPPKFLEEWERIRNIDPHADVSYMKETYAAAINALRHKGLSLYRQELDKQKDKKDGKKGSDQGWLHDDTVQWKNPFERKQVKAKSKLQQEEDIQHATTMVDEQAGLLFRYQQRNNRKSNGSNGLTTESGLLRPQDYVRLWLIDTGSTLSFSTYGQATLESLLAPSMQRAYESFFNAVKASGSTGEAYRAIEEVKKQARALAMTMKEVHAVAGKGFEKLRNLILKVFPNERLDLKAQREKVKQILNTIDPQDHEPLTAVVAGTQYSHPGSTLHVLLRSLLFQMDAEIQRRTSQEMRPVVINPLTADEIPAKLATMVALDIKAHGKSKVDHHVSNVPAPLMEEVKMIRAKLLEQYASEKPSYDEALALYDRHQVAIEKLAQHFSSQFKTKIASK